MKKFRKLLPALSMLLISALLMGSSTFAWFSMNTTVTATGMHVKAKAEDGIVISNVDKNAWNETAQAKDSNVKELRPTSTVDGTTWYHNSSKASDNATDYAGEFVTVQDSEKEQYYATYKFYIRSSSENDLTKDLYIKQVTIAINGTGAANSAELNKAIRVLVVVGETKKVFAPGSDSTLSYRVNNAESAKIAYDCTAEEGKNIKTSINSIPKQSTSTPVEVTVYVYYEGEDVHCKSTNIKATLDQMDISVAFEAKDPVSA